MRPILIGDCFHHQSLRYLRSGTVGKCGRTSAGATALGSIVLPYSSSRSIRLIRASNNVATSFSRIWAVTANRGYSCGSAAIAARTLRYLASPTRHSSYQLSFRRASGKDLFFSSPPSGSRLFDSKVFQLLPFFDRRHKPTGFCATTGPRVACPVSIFRWDFHPLQRTSTSPAPSLAS